MLCRLITQEEVGIVNVEEYLGGVLDFTGKTSVGTLVAMPGAEDVVQGLRACLACCMLGCLECSCITQVRAGWDEVSEST